MKIKISFLAILMLTSLVLTHSYISIAAILAATLHELGHILAARKYNIPLGELRLGILGASLNTSDMLCSYKKEMALAAAGPLTNLFTAALMLSFIKSTSAFTSLFISASLFLGLLNLLPIKDFDGGRILYCLLSEKADPSTASAVIRTLSFICIMALWLLSVYLLLTRSASLSLFIFSLALFCKIIPTQKKQIK